MGSFLLLPCPWFNEKIKKCLNYAGPKFLTMNHSPYLTFYCPNPSSIFSERNIDACVLLERKEFRKQVEGLACKTGRDCAMTICFSKLGIIYKIRV
jgi:hypothetical protein